MFIYTLVGLFFECEFICVSMRFLVKSNLNHHYKTPNVVSNMMLIQHKHNPLLNNTSMLSLLATGYSWMPKMDKQKTTAAFVLSFYHSNQNDASYTEKAFTCLSRILTSLTAQVHKENNLSTQQKDTNFLLCCRKAHLLSWIWMSQEAVYSQRPVHRSPGRSSWCRTHLATMASRIHKIVINEVRAGKVCPPLFFFIYYLPYDQNDEVLQSSKTGREGGGWI